MPKDPKKMVQVYVRPEDRDVIEAINRLVELDGRQFVRTSFSRKAVQLWRQALGLAKGK